MTKYQGISRIQFLLKCVNEQSIERVWSRVGNENPELDNDEIADKVEGHFGIASHLNQI